MRSFGIFIASLLAFTTIPEFANAALVFAINNSEGSAGNLFTFTDANPNFTFTVKVRRDDFDSGGDRLESFGFRVLTSAPGVAKLTAVNLLAPNGSTTIAGIFEPDANPTTLTDAAATARGNYVTRPLVHFPGPGNWVSLASFTLSGVSSSGTTNITIEELTIGPNDFLLGDALGAPTGQDRIGFSGDGSVIGLASTTASFTSNITAVPEPTSLLLVSAVAIGAVRFRRRYKHSI